MITELEKESNVCTVHHTVAYQYIHGYPVERSIQGEVLISIEDGIPRGSASLDARAEPMLSGTGDSGKLLSKFFRSQVEQVSQVWLKLTQSAAARFQAVTYIPQFHPTTWTQYVSMGNQTIFLRRFDPHLYQ